uniref:Ig-like domain-containing protein n=1 Tax=Neogobius melanostomus TaxID=47308 RepID=A0A8C6V074_9GOBI
QLGNSLCVFCSCPVHSVELLQPGSVLLQPAQTLSISCRVSGYSLTDSSYATGWIRQRQGKLEWIFHQWSDGSLNRNNALKDRFSVSRDTSAGTVTIQGQRLQPDDSAVYYLFLNWCTIDNSHCDYEYFDYWGKGTQVTVTSATSTAPTVYPVMPCSSDSGDITLACLATGFSPSKVSFSWTQNGTALTDFLQYPSVPLENDLHSGVSQIRIKRQDWTEQHQYKCKVEHAAGIREVTFLYMCVFTLSCLANNFVPNVYEFKWLKDNQEINPSQQFTTPSKAEKTDNGTLYSVASFLTVPEDDLRDDPKLTCKFELGRGQKQQSTNKDLPIIINPPTLEEMLYHGSGKLHCQVTVKDKIGVRSVEWEDEAGNTLMNNTDSGADVSGNTYNLYLDITYEEWTSGIKRSCYLHHKELPAGRKEEYKPPSVFMLAPLKHSRDNKVTLTCFVKDFNPEEIYVKWLVNDQPTMYDFNTTNSVRSNGAYYVYSHLTVPLADWEGSEQVYSCLVYHESLEKHRNIVRSIMQHSSEQVAMVNLNMGFDDMCKCQPQ